MYGMQLENNTGGDASSVIARHSIEIASSLDNCNDVFRLGGGR